MRVAEGVWGKTEGVNEARRARVDREFLERAELRSWGDDEQGVFALRPIAEGTPLVHRWHDEYYPGMVGWEARTVAEIDAMPRARNALFRRYGLDRDFGAIFGPLFKKHVNTLDNFINHSCEPNVGYDAEGDVVPLRALAAGEQLRLDYGGFVVNYDEPWECQCGAAKCRKSITRLDWKTLPLCRLPPFVARRRG